MDLQEVGYVGMDWIQLAQERDRWRALLNAVMSFGFHKMRGISLLSENRLAFQGLRSIEYVPLGLNTASFHRRLLNSVGTESRRHRWVP